MKQALALLVVVATFLGFTFGFADCHEDCGRGRTMIAFNLVGSAQAAPAPKEIIIPKFCKDVVFVWYAEYSTDTMHVSPGSKPPALGFYAGDFVRESLLQEWGKQQVATTGKGYWSLATPDNVRVTRLSVKAIALETYRPGEEGKVLWYKTWKANLPINDGISEWTSPEKEKC